MTLTVKELSSKMSDIDFCMLSTKNQGPLASRPMSNNGDVEYDGDSWFFSYEDSGKVRQIEHDSNVSLTFTAGKGLLGSPGIFISIEGEAELVRDRNAFAEHWTSDLENVVPRRDRHAGHRAHQGACQLHQILGRRGAGRDRRLPQCLLQSSKAARLARSGPRKKMCVDRPGPFRFRLIRR